MGFIRYIKNQFRHDRNMKRMLNTNAASISTLYREMIINSISRRSDWLKEKVISSTEAGITNERLVDGELIVSLTTFGRRIKEVYLTIESIMQGTVKPNRIVLWLSEEEFKGKKLPLTLQKQQNRGLQIEYCKNILSYKKIVPTMLKYPDAYVVTIDDDMMYEFDLLENLIDAHHDNPMDVCACRMHRITLDDHKRPNSYMQWNWMIWPQDKSNLNFLTSGGGTLFPPHCFIREFFNEESFMSLCPYADDVWINAMIWESGRHITKAYTHSLTGCDYIDVSADQDVALSEQNIDATSCRNDIQIKAVMDKYDLYHYLVEE